MRRCVLLSLLLGCSSPPAPAVPAPVLARWRSDAIPLRLELSTELTPTQRAGVIAASTWWEARTGVNLFYVREVPPSALSVSGLPAYGVVAVAPGPTSAPGVLDDARITTLVTDIASLHSVSVTVSGESVQAFAHELGHALGLGDVESPGSLMTKVHDGDTWALTEADLAVVP